MPAQVPKFDDARATDILKLAHENSFYPDPLPDSPETRVMEAEKIIQLALQAEKIANEAGTEKVKHYDKVMEILALAQVDGGTPSSPVQQQTIEDLAAPTPEEKQHQEALKQAATIPDLSSLDREGLKKFIKERQLGIRVRQNWSDDRVRERIMEEIAGGEEEPEPTDDSPAEVPAGDLVKIVVAGAQAEWTWQDIFTHVLDNGNLNLAFVNPDDQAKLDEERIRRTAVPESDSGGGAAPESPSPSVPASAPPESEQAAPPPTSDYAKGARWGDEQGVVWVIDQDLGDNVEAHPDGTSEQTILPKTFLVRKVEEQPKEEPSTTEPSSSADSPTAPSPSSTQPSEAVPSAPATSSTTTSSAPSPEPAASPPQQPSGDDTYDALVAKVQGDYESAGLPLPGDVPDPPQMPDDLTVIPDIQARKLHSQFNSCSARAHFLLGYERQIKIGCKRLREQSIKQPMAKARAELGAKAGVGEVVALAEDDPQVSLWKQRENYHADREAAYSDLFAIYTENVSVLSRDYTMREQQEHGKT